MAVRLVNVMRSGVVESSHIGDIVVAGADGKVLFKVGDPERLTFLRSSAKPILAVVPLEAGIVEEYKLDLKEIALMASSHSGEIEHIDAIKVLMQKIGIDENMLACGAAEPVSKAAAKDLIANGLKPTKLHCNCSAKHIGVIAATKLKGLPMEGYHTLGHPIQSEIDKVITDFSGVEQTSIVHGVDGCGIIVHAIPLKNAAIAYANLCSENFMYGKYRKSQNYVLSAVTMYPEMVAGSGRFDTALMKNFGDRVIFKFGAEGVCCMGIPKKGIGIALKIEDGSERAVSPVAVEVLLQMKILKEDEAVQLMDFWMTPVLNHKGDRVGELQPVFKLS